MVNGKSVNRNKNVIGTQYALKQKKFHKMYRNDKDIFATGFDQNNSYGP